MLSALLKNPLDEPWRSSCFWWPWKQSAALCAACGQSGEDCHCSLGWIHHFCLTALRGRLSQLHLPLPPCPTLKWWKLLSQCFGRNTRSLSLSAFKNEHISGLKQHQPSFSTPPPHGTKEIRKRAHQTHTLYLSQTHTHTHPTQISNLLPPGHRFTTISGCRGGGHHRSHTDQILMGREWTLVQREITRGQQIGSRSRCLTPLYGPVLQKRADLLP